MAKYSVTKGGQTYTYEYERSRFQNNTTEYNQEYYRANKEELRRKRIQKRIIERLEDTLNGAEIRRA